MEAIVPAFLLAVLTQAGDRPALFAAIIADRYGRPFTVALGALAAHGLGNAFAALGAVAVTPMLTPNAQTLMLAVALVLGGLSAFLPVRVPGRWESVRIGALLSAFLGTFSLALGGQTQFFTFALATRGEPWFAAAGASAGAFVVAFVAAVLGELGWRGIRFGWLRVLSGLAFLAAGLWLGASALRLL